VTPEASEIFNGDASGDAVSRLEKVDDVLERVVTGNETAIRLMLANSLQQRAKGDGAGEMPVRQDRRTPLIEAALAPSRAKMKPADLAKLKSALALIVGTESMIVFRDVLQLGDTEARKVRRWAIRALVDAAMK